MNLIIINNSKAHFVSHVKNKALISHGSIGTHNLWGYPMQRPNLAEIKSFLKKKCHMSTCEWYEVTWTLEILTSKFNLGTEVPYQTFTYGTVTQQYLPISSATAIGICHCISLYGYRTMF